MKARCPTGEHSDCENRDHTCGCGECCDACWFDCCASGEDILVAMDMMTDFTEPLTNCGFVPLAQVEFLIHDWTKRTEL